MSTTRNPITVSLDLQSEQEVVLFSQLLQIIVKERAQAEQRAANQQRATAPAVSDAPQGPTSAWSPPAAPPAEAKVVADISPASVERKFREFIVKAGSGAARALLDKYKAPYLKDVPAEQLAAFAAELGE